MLHLPVHTVQQQISSLNNNTILDNFIPLDDDDDDPSFDLEPLSREGTDDSEPESSATIAKEKVSKLLKGSSSIKTMGSYVRLS